MRITDLPSIAAHTYLARVLNVVKHLALDMMTLCY
jgi:hypothetical protein